MADIYTELLQNLSDLRKTADDEVCGMDAFLSDRVKVASMDDLFNFARIGNDTLVHKAEKDLWRISEDQGQLMIERLFDPESKNPIRV